MKSESVFSLAIASQPFGEIKGVKFLARSSGGVNFLTNLMSPPYVIEWHGGIVLEPKNNK